MNRIALRAVALLPLRVLLLAAFCNFLPLAPFSATASAADSVRPQVGKPLQAAQALMKTQKYKEALAKIGEADAVADKTPYETLVIEQMRGAAAAGAGDIDVAAKAFDAVFAANKLPPAEQLKIMQSVASNYYRVKAYAKAQAWIQRYQKAGGNDPNIGLMLIQSQYLAGDYASAAKGMQDVVAAEEKAGKAPSEEQLQLLASCYVKQNNGAAYVGALEKLVTYHPKKEYWADLLARVQRKPGFSDRLSLDVYRLMQMSGTLKEPGEYMEMAQLALQAGYPREAQKVLQQGYANKTLGAGPDADRQKRLQVLADKQAAEDQKTLAADVQAKNADGLVNAGFNLVVNGQNDKGLSLMQQGIAKGGLKRPDEARLHLGVAYLMAGRNEDAVKTFKAVQGRDGSQDLARLFTLAAGKSGA